MMNISMIAKTSTSNQLTFKILDLDDMEKNYDGFRIKIENLTEWYHIPIKGTDLFESDVYTFENLNPLTMYKVAGQAKYRAEWIDVAGASFKTHFRKGSDNIPIPPIGESNKSGAIFVGNTPKEIVLNSSYQIKNSEHGEQITVNGEGQ